jgi:chromosome segregation ATPase
MKKSAAKIAVVLLLISAVGALGYLYYEYRVLQAERDDLDSKLASVTKRADLLQSRYKEQKALEANLLRTKLTLEGHIGKLQAEISDLQKENAKLIDDKSDLAKTLRGENQALQTRIEALVLQNQNLVEALQAEKLRYAQTVEAHTAQVRVMQTQAQTLNANLKRTGLKLDRCVENNQRLAAIGEELLYRYENKGVMDSFLENEPFIQTQRVELEKLVQEYAEKIEKEKIVQ